MAWTLVTGGAKRLGADICINLASAGYDVVVHYNTSHSEAINTVEKCRSYGVQADLIQGDFSSLDGVLNFSERYLEQFGETENLINNVGNYIIKSALQTTTEEWMSLFQTNLNAPFILIKKLIPSIITHKGSIMNIGVVGAEHLHANLYSTVYLLTKMSLLALTRSLAKELAPEGIRVNMVSPGLLDISVDIEEFLNKTPMHKAASCEEVSRVVTFLLDRKNGYITGQNIEIAGGLGL
ncbi:MAG: SDR family oxidoreductase [Parachlamydiaceae bacterium]|nr:SDR family oxidoreductase [Parachlamydiaceae bacterium]